MPRTPARLPLPLIIAAGTLLGLALGAFIFWQRPGWFDFRSSASALTARQAAAMYRQAAQSLEPLVEKSDKENQPGMQAMHEALKEEASRLEANAKELTAEQWKSQRQGRKAVNSQQEIVITAARVFDRPAPRSVTRDMVGAMQRGGVIVDMAVESGGNVEGSQADAVVDVDGVSIVGVSNLPAEVSRDASQMYSSNLFNLVTEFWDEENKTFNLDLGDDILQGCVITHEGVIVNEAIKNLRS